MSGSNLVERLYAFDDKIKSRTGLLGEAWSIIMEAASELEECQAAVESMLEKTDAHLRTLHNHET